MLLINFTEGHFLLQDGSLIIHTVRKGHYMRTLRPPNNPDYVMNIPMLAVDDTGHIIVYCHETFPIDLKVGLQPCCTQKGQNSGLLALLSAIGLTLFDVKVHIIVYFKMPGTGLRYR